jgi:hypothetical protein
VGIGSGRWTGNVRPGGQAGTFGRTAHRSAQRRRGRKTGDPVGGYVPAGSARLFVGLGGGSACVNVRCSGGRWGLCVLVMMELRYLWGTST